MKSTFFFSISLPLLVIASSCSEQKQATKENEESIENTESSKTAEKEVEAISVAVPDAPEGMVYIHGGTYKRGSQGEQENGTVYHEESPPHDVTVSSFFIETTEVTNAQFKKFIDATGYKTFAETGATSKDFPLAPPDALVPGASIFTPTANKIDPRRSNPQTWWPFIPGASWKHPQGPGSTIDDLMDHPVVCINHNDAEAYATWAGKRLPTEAEWEYAARGGLKEKNYTWGDTRLPGKWMANCFQGSFPAKNTSEDGFDLSAPVKSFEPNGYGLYDMAGNVWEMCSDYYRPDYYKTFVKSPVIDPKGPKKPISQLEISQWMQTGTYTEPTEPIHPLVQNRVSKGGSFLCHVEYCLRYRPAARHYSEMLTPTNHIGFRCVQDIPTKE